MAPDPQVTTIIRYPPRANPRQISYGHIEFLMTLGIDPYSNPIHYDTARYIAGVIAIWSFDHPNKARVELDVRMRSLSLNRYITALYKRRLPKYDVFGEYREPCVVIYETFEIANPQVEVQHVSALVDSAIEIWNNEGLSLFSHRVR